MIRSVLFDLDGTLLDTEPDFTDILNRLLVRHHRPPVSRAAVRQTVSSGARALVGLGFGVDETDPRFAGWLDELLALYDEAIPRTQCLLFQDVDRLLDSLCTQGWRWGIVTNKPSRFTDPLLKQVEGLRDCGVVICRDHVAEGKPHPAGLLKACAALGVQPADTVYVGDHPRDIEAGRNAGMLTIAAAWGYLPEGERAEDWGADLVAHSAADIESYLFTLDGKS